LFFRKIIKYEICKESKFIKTSFQLIEIKSEYLDLIYSHIGDLKFMQFRDGKKYYIIFIDDCTMYCYTYLLKRKY